MRERLLEKIETLTYRVEEFGGLGDKRELECLKADLAALEDEETGERMPPKPTRVAPLPDLSHFFHLKTEPGIHPRFH
jgi:hypothetical protein